MKTLFVSLDLEMNQPSGRIIQVGAVLGRLDDGARLSRFSAYVNPGEPLAEDISTLCGITPATLEMAGTLEEAFELLKRWMHPFAEQRQLNPLTWGGGDADLLREQLNLQDARWPFGRRWVDVKTVFAAWQHANGQEANGGLGTSMKRVGLVFEGRKHDAADDAWNTFRMYHRLLRLMRPTDGTAP